MHHRLQAELAATRCGQGQADQSARFADHEIDVLRAHFFRGHDEIAFVLAILVIKDHDHASGADVVEDVGDGVEAHCGCPSESVNVGCQLDCRKRLQPRCSSLDIRNRSIAAEAAS